MRNTYENYAEAHREITAAAASWPNHLTDTAKARIISALLTYGEACREAGRTEGAAAHVAADALR